MKKNDTTRKSKAMSIASDSGGKNLVVVESPSKTKKLASFLGKNYEVVSSVGHVRDLPKTGLAVDIENNFEPQYVVSPDKSNVVSDLKKKAKNADAIYLATDLDREGEAIAWHVAYLINNESDLKDAPEKANYDVADKLKNSPKVYRVTFNSITKEAVLESFESPRKLNDDLIGAQQGRRVLDRLVGYKLSPLLWEKIRYGLSAGRVQSVAVRLVVERENEIKNFIKDPYFEISIDVSPEKSKERFPAKLVSINDEGIYKKQKFELFAGDYTASKTTIDTEDKAKSIEGEINEANLKVKSVETKDIKSHPSPPFTTATLQQAASSNLGYAPKRTMQLAQKLYEGGYITYMRTDSVHITPATVKGVRDYIKRSYGDEYLLNHERFFKGRKEAKTQEAHEAIRPTDVKVKADDLPKAFEQHKKLYDLIWRRTVATQMTPAVYGNTNVKIETEDKKYLFEAKGSFIKFDGYLKVYRSKKDDLILPEVKEGDKLKLNEILLESKEMSPPPRYNESSLVKELEKFNIGRPSTYASIISTIQSRGYVQKVDKSLYATDNGIVVNNLLVDHFPEIVDVEFTANMEDDLDEVAEGKLDWHDLVKNFYGPFEQQIAVKKKELKKEDIVVLEKTDEVCPECGKGHLIVKLGKFGKFLSCDQYPDCKYARPIENPFSVTGEGEEGINEEEIPELKEKCPEDGGQLVLKEGRYGKFIACENYPKCKFTKALLKKIGVKCPKCGEEHGGEVVAKKTKRQRLFYGCSRYPDCDYASWTKPGSEDEATETKAKKPRKKRAKTS